MFELTVNNFLKNNTCKYIDEYKNTAFMKRTEDGIVAKLRFADKRITADPLFVKVPQDGKEGDNIRVHYPNEELLKNTDVVKAFENFTLLINYWINMVCDIKLLDVNNIVLKKLNPGATEEDIAQHKLSLLYPYKELENVVSAVLK